MSWLFGTPLSRARRLVSELREASRSRQAEEELLKMGKEAVPALVEALGTSDQTLRARATEVLIRFGAIATPMLVAQLNISPPPTQVQICKIFAQTRATEALPALLGALRSPFSEVRLQAAETIGGIGNPTILPSLKQFAKDESIEVRIASVISLGYFPQAISFLIELLLDDPAIEVRRTVARVLARLRDPAALPALIEALQDSRWWYEREKEYEDLLNAILAFGSQAVPALLQIVEHPERTVRRFALILLGKLRDPRTIPALEIALYDLHFEIGQAAAEALLGFGKEGASILLQALHTQKPRYGNGWYVPCNRYPTQNSHQRSLLVFKIQAKLCAWRLSRRLQSRKIKMPCQLCKPSPRIVRIVYFPVQHETQSRKLQGKPNCLLKTVKTLPLVHCEHSVYHRYEQSVPA